MSSSAGTDGALLFEVLLRLGDNALVLGQQLGGWIARAPTLEEEMAIANLALDLIGQARVTLAYAGEVEGRGRDEDALAYWRDDGEFRNLQLVEQPNGHFGDTIVRQVLYEAFHCELFEALAGCADERLRAIAARSLKEARYHLRHAGHWLVRLGGGTEESHRRVSESLQALWPHTGEMLTPDEIDTAFAERLGGPDLGVLARRTRERLTPLFAEACLELPPPAPALMASGKRGRHSEHLGYLLAEMQHLHRSHPGAAW